MHSPNFTPQKINGWNIIMEVWKIIFLSKWVICRCKAIPLLHPCNPETSLQVLHWWWPCWVSGGLARWGSWVLAAYPANLRYTYHNGFFILLWYIFFLFWKFPWLTMFPCVFFSCFCFTLQAPVELQYGMLYAYLYLEVSHHRWALGCEATGKQTSGLRALGAQFSTSALAFHARRFTGAPNGTGQGGRFLRVDALQQNKTPWSLQLNPVRVQGPGGRKHLWQFHISAIFVKQLLSDTWS